MTQFLRFCGVGSVGFFADAGMTVALTSLLHFGPLLARALAFFFAATITWYLNQFFTFQAKSGIGSLLSYVFLTSVGAFINIGIYTLWIRIMSHEPIQIIFGVAAGSAVALIFNYWVSRNVIFKKRSPCPE